MTGAYTMDTEGTNHDVGLRGRTTELRSFVFLGGSSIIRFPRHLRTQELKQTKNEDTHSAVNITFFFFFMPLPPAPFMQPNKVTVAPFGMPYSANE